MHRLIVPLVCGAAAVLVAGTLTIVAITVPKIASAAAKNCEVALEVRDAYRDLLVRAQTLSAENPTMSREQRKVAADFYRVTIARADAVHC